MSASDSKLVLLAALLLGGAPAAMFSCQPGHSQNGAATPSVQLPAVPPRELRSPDAFTVYSERVERSRALFGEAARVMLHPRCANCHPSGDTPLQREGGLHDPPVQRGAEDRGVVGMECTGCHQDQNLELARVPGAPNWHLAPRSMAWVGHDPGSICAQIKDPARNGGKSLAQIVDHSQHDALVAWGWAPGGDREPAPGSQAQFGALVAAWVESGAECPPANPAALGARDVPANTEPR